MSYPAVTFRPASSNPRVKPPAPQNRSTAVICLVLGFMRRLHALEMPECPVWVAWAAGRHSAKIQPQHCDMPNLDMQWLFAHRASCNGGTPHPSRSPEASLPLAKNDSHPGLSPAGAGELNLSPPRRNQSPQLGFGGACGQRTWRKSAVVQSPQFTDPDALVAVFFACNAIR